MTKPGQAIDLRGFLAELEADDPNGILRIAEPVSLDYDVTAVAMELERRGQAPVLWFERVGDGRFPVVANVFASRRLYARALGVPEDKLIEAWANLGDKRLPPKLVETGPIRDVVLTGDKVDLGYLPIMKHFNEDGGRYITNGIVIAKDPETGVRNASFHRMQVKGRTRVGTSLHSRRHLWNYVQRAEAMGLKEVPVAVVVGAHPMFIFGSGLWKGPIDADEYEVAGGFLGRPLEIVPGVTVPVESPAHAEIVLEGRILCGVREPEGPFAEFTGYASERSTQQVIEFTAITHRRNAIYHNIIPGISDEHTGLLAVPQEARLTRVLRQNFPNVVAVAYPKSGGCRFHAYVAMRKPAPGQAKNAAAAALGDDLSLKLVVVVDDDVDIRSDQDVMWAIATRFQADRDVDILRNAMGAILDPSNNAGLTAKVVVDATRPVENFPRRHTLPADAVARARAILQRRS